MDNWDVEGAHGVLNIYGALTESTCHLEMDSAYQEIKMGETGASRLRKPGDQGTPVPFLLRLRDCLHTSTSVQSEVTETHIWSSEQIAVTMTFSSPTDKDNFNLIKVKGVSGLGLRLVHEDGRNVALGQRDNPIMLNAGTNILNFKIIPERTSAPLVVGAYRTYVYFRLNYD
ncbi:type 1 fimbrial protein [Citrobacter portucalensis]|uniref:Type 1 fimbrial protein n=1 Tax=Citrobacter portucalensis TaxID=1639133 RepID=A0AAW5WE15_9ENTR|nr:fimbrial protein [Citrobacter portucalensis]MCX9004737.1 type 1 fimbrial protein [Citrobacter portucalensis]